MDNYTANDEIETFRFIDWDDLSEESVTLPIDKIVVNILKGKENKTMRYP